LLLPNHDDFRVGAAGQRFCGLDPFPFEQGWRDASGHDLLEVAHSGCRDTLPLCLLRSDQAWKADAAPARIDDSALRRVEKWSFLILPLAEF
jgi:hypothetical protein